MNDQDLQRLLQDTLPATPLHACDDAELEVLLDAQENPDSAYGQGMLARAHRGSSTPKKANRWLTIAALIVLTVIPISIVAIAISPVEPDVATGNTPPKPAPDVPSPEAGLVEHRPEFPDPIFTGTPRDIDLPNLEPAHSPRLTFSAPSSVHLVSDGAAVTSSAAEPLFGEFVMVTDGNKVGDDKHLLELPPGPQWVQIDLGESKEIFAITLWHYHKKWRAYRDVVIQASDEPDFSNGSPILFNNDHDNSLGFGEGNDLAYIETEYGKIVDVSQVKARYLRFYSNGNTTDEFNHYVEIEVYGL